MLNENEIITLTIQELAEELAIEYELTKNDLDKLIETLFNPEENLKYEFMINLGIRYFIDTQCTFCKYKNRYKTLSENHKSLKKKIAKFILSE